MTDTIVLAEGGMPLLMEWCLRAAIPGVLDTRLLLFANALDPDCDVVLADLTECTFAGYNRVTLNRAAWQPATVVGCCATMRYGTVPQTWVNSGEPATVGGWAILYPMGDVLLAVQALSEPLELGAGVTMALRPEITLSAGACPDPP